MAKANAETSSDTAVVEAEPENLREQMEAAVEAVSQRYAVEQKQTRTELSAQQRHGKLPASRDAAADFSDDEPDAPQDNADDAPSDEPAQQDTEDEQSSMPEPETDSEGDDDRKEADAQGAAETAETQDGEDAAWRAEVAKRYGMDAKDTSEFQSAAAFERALAFHDRQVQQRVRDMRQQAVDKPDAKAKAHETPAPKPEPPPAQEPAAVAADDADAVVVQHIEALDKHIKALEEQGYDDEVIAPIRETKTALEVQHRQTDSLTKKVNQLLEASAAQRAAQQQSQEAAEQQRFVELVDNVIKRPDLLGSGKEVTDAQRQAMTQLWQAYDAEAYYRESLGEEYPLTEAAINRAFLSVFGPRVQHELAAKRSQKIKNQSRSIMGRGQAAQGRDDMPPTGDLRTDPQMRKFAREHGLALPPT